MCRCRIYLDSETPAPKVNCRASWFCIQTQLPGIINSMHPLPRGFVCFLAYAFNTYIKQNLLPNSKSAYWFYHHHSSEIWANFLSRCPWRKETHLSLFPMRPKWVLLSYLLYQLTRSGQHGGPWVLSASKSHTEVLN